MLSTPQGGKIALDATLLAIWERADGHSLDEIIAGEGAADPEQVRAALACLAEAGLLDRHPDPHTNTLLPTPSQVLEQANQPTTAILDQDSDFVRKSCSAIIVNYNSLEWLQECLQSLQSQTYAMQEIIIVDNGSSEVSTTISLESLVEKYPQAHLYRLPPGYSLAYAINHGVEQATGEYFLLLNPDTRLEPNALAEMIAVSQHHPDCAAVASKLRYLWAPGFINGLGNHVSPSSWGADNAQGHLDLGQFDHWGQVPSACFAAALIPRTAWEAVGPLDENYPLYYEDADWSYRARLAGFSILLAPQAIIYHAMGRQAHTGEDTGFTPFKLSNVTNGRLRFASKILSPLTKVRFLLSYALQDCLLFGMQLFKGKPRLAAAIARGWMEFLHHLSKTSQSRRSVQAGRTITDQELLALQRTIPSSLIWHGIPELTWDLVCYVYLPLFQSGNTYPMPEFSTSNSSNSPAHRSRLLIISQDIVDHKMAGPGIRYLEMARALNTDLDVTLAVPGETSIQVPGLHIQPYRFDQPGAMRTLAEQSDIVLISSFILEKFPFLENLPQRQKSPLRVVVDLYDPLVLENLHIYQHESLEAQQSLNLQAVQAMNRLVRLGDFFICGNPRQRDFWVGVLAANGRINPLTFANDATLRNLIDEVGVGFPDKQPVQRSLMRGIHPTIPADAKIVLWGGGIWDWLDPLSLVRAWPQVLARHPLARLIFLGTRHPNPLVPPHKMAEQTETLAAELGEKDRTILFFEWLPYEDFETLLGETDVGVALHHLHVETRYSIRTRVLEYLWARLPVLVTEGDVTSEWVQQYGLGRVVPPLDVAAVAEALNDLLDQPKQEWAPNFEPMWEQFVWSQVVSPLRQYCLQGQPAPDRVSSHSSVTLPQQGTFGRLRANLARARYIWRTEGLRILLHRIWRYLQWRASR